MKEYNISPDNAKVLAKKAILKVIPVIIISAIVGISLVYYRLEGDDNFLFSVGFILVILIPVMYFTIKKGYKNNLRLYQKINYKVDDDSIIATDILGKVTCLKFDEINVVNKNTDGVILKGKPGKIFIMNVMDGFGELEIEINRKLMGRVEFKSGFNYSNALIILVLPVVGGVMYLSYFGSNLYVKLIASFVVVVGFFVSMVITYKNRSILPESTRKQFWILIVPLFFYIVLLIKWIKEVLN